MILLHLSEANYSIWILSKTKVFSLLLQEESQRQLKNSVTYNEMHALMAKKLNQQNYQPKSFKDKLKTFALHCTYCCYNGHRVDKCFQLHGYPPSWMDQKEKRNVFTHLSLQIKRSTIKIVMSNKSFLLFRRNLTN